MKKKDTKKNTDVSLYVLPSLTLLYSPFSPQPWMALINALVLFLYALVLRLYRWTASDLQRLDAVSRSPIQAALAEVCQVCFLFNALHVKCSPCPVLSYPRGWTAHQLLRHTKRTTSLPTCLEDSLMITARQC